MEDNNSLFEKKIEASKTYCCLFCHKQISKDEVVGVTLKNTVICRKCWDELVESTDAQDNAYRGRRRKGSGYNQWGKINNRWRQMRSIPRSVLSDGNDYDADIFLCPLCLERVYEVGKSTHFPKRCTNCKQRLRK